MLDGTAQAQTITTHTPARRSIQHNNTRIAFTKYAAGLGDATGLGYATGLESQSV